MMKTVLRLLLLVVAVFAPVVMCFSPSVAIVDGARSGCFKLYMTKRFPSGRPCTIQNDEDMAMWFEDKQGHAKKALAKPIGGRPKDKYTKEDVEQIEKKGINHLSEFKIYMEWFITRPTRGY